VAALLGRIGPAIIVTHSQSGPFGWLIADARLRLVKAVVAAQPAGPPFENAVFETKKAHAWGVTDIPSTYNPPVNDPAELKVDQQAELTARISSPAGSNRRRRGASPIWPTSRRRSSPPRLPCMRRTTAAQPNI
jgi:pimeloyl-ACP methyl ester carboxylesterase